MRQYFLCYFVSMNTPLSNEGLRFVSSRAKVARAALFSGLFITLVMALRIFSLDVSDSHIPLMYRLLMIAGLGLFSIAGAVIREAVDLRLTSEYLFVRQGLGLLRAKPRKVKLQNIHTISLTSQPEPREQITPFRIHLAYRWPERKMVYAEISFLLKSIPDSNQFIRALLDRTDTTIKLYSNTTMGEFSTHTAEELKGILEEQREPALPSSPVGVSSLNG